MNWRSNPSFGTSVRIETPSEHKGALKFEAVDNTNDDDITIKNAAVAAARTLTIPEMGGNASFQMSPGALFATAITAFATGGQASATALTAGFSNVTTVATAADSVKLLTAVAGLVQVVKNSGAAALDVFPNTSDSINALAVNLAVSIPVGSEMTFRAISATVWETKESVSRKYLINAEGKIGATAGFTLGGGAVNTGLLATVAASQTASTLVVPLPFLEVGDTITAFGINGQIDSAGNAVTVDLDLRRMTAVATGSTDASVSTITQISKTADYLIADEKTGLAEVVAATEGFYLLCTVTTGVTTDVEVVNVEVTVSKAVGL